MRKPSPCCSSRYRLSRCSWASVRSRSQNPLLQESQRELPSDLLREPSLPERFPQPQKSLPRLFPPPQEQSPLPELMFPELLSQEPPRQSPPATQTELPPRRELPPELPHCGSWIQSSQTQSLWDPQVPLSQGPRELPQPGPLSQGLPSPELPRPDRKSH